MKKVFSLIVFYVFFASLAIAEIRCLDHFREQDLTKVEHDTFVEQYEKGLEWEKDWDFEPTWFYQEALPVVCNTVEKNGLNFGPFTSYELVLMHEYTSRLYSEINTRLRMQDRLKEIDQILSNLDSGLKKFPLYQGWVKRGVYLPAAILPQYQIQSEVQDLAYISTSQWGVKTKFDEKRDQLKIYTCNGRDVSKISRYPEEKEILLPRGTKFLITKIKPKGSQNFYTMREVGCP